jgi:hypothetical protein
VGNERDQMLAGLLPPALELMTAFTQSDDDPGFFWQAVQRVLGEALADANPGRAMAEVTFGLSALSGILLDQLADATGRDRTEILADVHRIYLDA